MPGKLAHYWMKAAIQMLSPKISTSINNGDLIAHALPLTQGRRPAMLIYHYWSKLDPRRVLRRNKPLVELFLLPHTS